MSNNRLNDKRLKIAIYNCQNNFLEKIDDSSRSLAQVLNSLAVQILARCQENSSNEILFSELSEFLEYTIGYINDFPSKSLLHSSHFKKA